MSHIKFKQFSFKATKRRLNPTCPQLSNRRMGKSYRVNLLKVSCYPLISVVSTSSDSVRAQSYLSSVVQQDEWVCLTRLSCSKHLAVPQSKTRYGNCSFSVAAPTLWNRLPKAIRSAETLDEFKSLLKTHLFHQYFS